jgi:hypothetical protein
MVPMEIYIVLIVECLSQIVSPVLALFGPMKSVIASIAALDYSDPMNFNNFF